MEIIFIPLLLSFLPHQYTEKPVFIFPLTIPVDISAGYGEIRQNHFHSGIDFATQQREGVPVLAAADGYIARIGVSSTNFGKVLYIVHPNGYTTVYAHLKEFLGPVAAYVKEEQYRRESFHVQLYPEANQFRVRQGDTIALSGNTGNSSGPHLHFEIRETDSQRPLNPLAFYYALPPSGQFTSSIGSEEELSKSYVAPLVADTDSPVITEMMIYALSGGQILLPDNRRVDKHRLVTRKSGETYVAEGMENIRICGNIGFAVNASDRLASVGRSTDIYAIEMQVNGITHYQFVLDRFAFDETRYVNAHIDYAESRKTKKIFHRCFILPGNKFSAYRNVLNQGILTIQPGRRYDVEIRVSDIAENHARLRFSIQGIDTCSSSPPFSVCNNLYYPGQSDTFSAPDIRFVIPANALYDTICLQISKQPIYLPGAVSNIWGVHDVHVPLYRACTLQIHSPLLQAQYHDKVYVARLEDNQKLLPAGGKYENGFVSTTITEFGNYAVVIDTTPPLIMPINITTNADMSQEREIRIRIRDEQSGIESYRATVNGKWILMEYDAKNDLLVYYFDERVPAGSHQLRLIVRDKCNNLGEINIPFKR